MLRLPQKVLKLACWVLGAVLVVQIALLFKHADPLKRLSIPALPTLAAAADAQSGGKGTNAVAGGEADKKETNAALSGKTEKAGTNTPASGDLGKQGTNAAAVKAPGTNGINGTNAISARMAEKEATNTVTVEEADKNETKSPPSEKDSKTETNSVVIKKAGKNGTNSVATVEREKTGTNSVETKAEGSGTNSSQAQKSGKAGTNTVASKEPGKKGKPGGLRQDAGKAPADLPPRIKTRVEYITQSEILGQIVRPMPMALLGIADKDVFLRAPDGQTGTIKEGDELGGVKLLRVGTNRILIEYEGEKKELTIFSGLGSETLLPKATEKTNEITKKTP
jgi:hypothetical protein